MLPAEISSTGNFPKPIMVASVSSCDEVGAFVYPLGGQLPGATRFPDRGLFDKLSWLAKTNRVSYLSQPGGGVVTHEKRASCISIAQCCAPRGRNANSIRIINLNKI